MSGHVSYPSYPQFAYGTTAVNGLVTPITYPLADEPQIQELIAPLEDLSAQGASYQYDSMPYGYQHWVAPDVGKEQVYAMDNMFPQQQVVPQPWQFTSQYLVSDVPTAPSSPAFLPIQGSLEASPLSLETQNLPTSNQGEELVGMGLYDSPAEVQNSSLLFGGGWDGVARKKSLKLEESFQPAPESSEAGEEKDSDAEDESDEEVDEEAHPVEMRFHQNTNFKPAPSMAGQSFFFDSEADLNAAAYTTNMAYMQDGGYRPQYTGYGWV